MSNTISGMVSSLFSQIDTTGKGYLSKTDFESAFSQVSSTTSTSSADELFSTLDSNGDGKLTQDEMSSSIQKLADALDSQFQSMRMASAMGAHGTPPPPPPANDAGFTKDELQSQLDSIGSSDSTRSSLIAKIISNFSAADTNGDGKVSFQEAMTYDQANPSSGSTTSSSSTTSSTRSSSSGTTTSSDTTTSALTSAAEEMKLMLTIMQLMNAYQSNTTASTTSSVSTSV